MVLCRVIKKRWGKREVMIRDKNQGPDLNPQHSKYIKSTVACWDVQTTNIKPALSLKAWPPLTSSTRLLYLNRHICPHHPAPICFVCFYCLYSGTAVSIPVLATSFSFAFPFPTLHTSLYSLCPCLLFILQSQQHQLAYSSCYTSPPSSTVVFPHRR